MNITKAIDIYKDQLEQEVIQFAYKTLVDYVAYLKTKFPNQYSTGSISLGYLDFTYFPFHDEYLRKHKLRFGIVLNHEKMQFELWLMGQNADVQKRYWEILKNTEWNKDKTSMPKYSVLEVCIEDNIDFDNKEKMTQMILSNATKLSEEIEEFLRKSEKE